MAARRNAQAAALMEAEQAEREENADINEAIARTDSEVFTDAMGDEPLEDDAGTELEEMGDGLEGEELEEEDEEDEGPPDRTKGQYAEGEPEGDQVGRGVEEDSEGIEGDDAEREEDVGPPPAVERPQQPSIPPRVLREAREQWRNEMDELRAQNRDLQMRLDNFVRQPLPTQQPQPTQQQPSQPIPDMFADPAGHDAALIAEAERRAEAKFEQRFQQQQQMQQRDAEARLNESLSHTALGPRSYEFNVAYRDLISLEKTPENAALMRRVVSSPDPGQAILDWWEQSSTPEYIDYHREIVRQAYASQRPQRGAPQRQNGRVQGRQVPRHEVRLPRSLSEATGGSSQHLNDPEMFDSSEESVFAYGARR